MLDADDTEVDADSPSDAGPEGAEEFPDMEADAAAACMLLSTAELAALSPAACFEVSALRESWSACDKKEIAVAYTVFERTHSDRAQGYEG